MKDLTIIMPFLNEGDEPYHTINSIYETADPSSFEIIAIDDHSNKPSRLPIKKEINHIINKDRMGVNGCLNMGMKLAKTPYVFVLDAHMRFPNGWFEILKECITREPETAWCTSCMQLGFGNMDLSRATVEYTGATLLMVDKVANEDRPAREVLEPKWMASKKEMEYEIPCILGANYFFSKKWLDHINGLEGLKTWGTEEPFLSLKTWMAGGKCKITRNIRIGHKFRDNAPYSTHIWTMIYNKIFLCKTILPDELGNKLIDFMPKNNNFTIAMQEIEKNNQFIKQQKDYYQGILNVKIEDICRKFNINLP